MSRWLFYKNGQSIGTKGTEGGLILFDEENSDGARITLARKESMVSISIKIYGWIDHTRFFTADFDAQREYRAMKLAINPLLSEIKSPDVNNIRVWEMISDFVRRFP